MGLKLDPCFWHLLTFLSQERSLSKSEKVHAFVLYVISCGLETKLSPKVS